MAVATKRPNIIRRVARSLGEAYGIIPSRERAAWLEGGEWQHHTDLLDASPVQRIMRRTHGDIASTYGAVFAAIRLRERMVTRPRIYLVRVGRGDVEEVAEHPALDALRRVNESLTERQGRELIEKLLLTWGKAFLVKRRNRLNVPVEFEFWPPDEVEVVKNERKWWVPKAFRRHLPNGSTETVAPADVVWFRHYLDPRNILNGLSPIAAARVQIDTGYEAQRFNQRFFINNAIPAAIATVEEGGPAAVERIEQELERKFKGTDNASRIMVTEGGLQIVSTPLPHKDMQFLEQMRWTREEVAACFELHPISLGASEGTTFSNVEWIDRKDWNVIVDDLENQLAQWNEFYVWPDFGREFELRADFSAIPALQENRKLRAEADEIELRSAKVFINELRERDGQNPVPWGDMPVVPNTMGPLDSRTGAEKDAAKPQPVLPSGPEPPRSREIDGADMPPSLDQAQARMARAWERRLRRELRRFLDHLEAADRRAFGPEDVNSYDWDWRDDYGEEVILELTLAYERALVAEAFVATPLLPTHQLAVNYARARAGELLSESGRFSIPAGTRERVAALVAKALEQGDSLRQLKNALRQDVAFSPSRAETVARTETATALGRASLQAYTSNGYEGKRWQTSGFDVDNGDAFGPCVVNEAAGTVRLHESFPSGDDTPPAHPRCRCTLVPVFEVERKARRIRKRGTLDGREIDIIEEEIDAVPGG